MVQNRLSLINRIPSGRENVNLFYAVCEIKIVKINDWIGENSMDDMNKNPYVHIIFKNKNDTLGTYERMKKSGYLRKRLIV